MAKYTAEKLLEKLRLGTLAAEDMDGMSLEEVNLLHSKASVLKQMGEIEDIQARVAERKQKRNEILAAHKSQQAAIDQFNRDVEAEQIICRHRKGGKNLPGILNGRDSDHSIIVNTYPWGETRVMCTRCTKEWKRPAAKLLKTDPKLYRRLMAEYQEALRFPTDNEPSGSQLFTFTQEPTPAVAEAMA